jgi:hypothetical protein
MAWLSDSPDEFDFVLDKVPSFLAIPKATPKVKEAPLPPAIRMTLSAAFAKLGTAPYDPSNEARRLAPGYFTAKS